MTASYKSRARKAVVITLLALLFFTSATSAGQLRLPFSRYRLPDISLMDQTDADPAEGSSVTVGEEGEGEGESETGKKVAGAVMFGSGLFLCSWGIADWQFSDAQCCPARNTENVAKIIVGVVLINAGLVYLIAGGL